MVDDSIRDRYKIQKLVPRTISAVVIGPIILYIVYKGGGYFSSLMALLALLMAIEWAHIVSARPQHARLWYVIGMVYIALPILSLIYLRYTSLYMLLWLLAVVWASDIGAYIFGIAFGGPKLCPKASPSKTWSGFFGAIALSGTTGWLISIFWGVGIANPLFMSIAVSVVAQLGDLLESLFKRVFGVKDSGALIPGHGGVLDRVDSLVTSSLFLALYHIIMVYI